LEWMDRMRRALDYLEERLDQPLDMEGAARRACASVFHFQRMFHMLTGVTVAEYVRKRRLTLAAQALASSDARVLDVALQYGYDTPESFAKAFRKAHGISPSAAREPGTRLKAYPRLSFHIVVKGDQEMDYQIMDKPAFRVVGKATSITTADGENFRRIPRFWRECMDDGSWQRVVDLAQNGTTFGICADFSPELKEFTYLIAAATAAAVPEGMAEREIPAATWAVFQAVGPLPGSIQQVTRRIFSEWFPATGYEHADGPELEVYPPGDGDAADYRCEVWIPIVRKG
jgi:AraC family transcriptional regulator